MSAGIALAITLALYLAAAVLIAAGHLRGVPASGSEGRPGRVSGWIVAGRIAAVVGGVTHMGAIGLRCVELHRAPFATTGEALSLLAWMIVLAFLIVDVVWRLTASGAFALGVSFLLLLLAGVRGDVASGTGTAPLLNERAVSLHIVAILGAFAAFALAFSTAVLYLIERQILRSKHGLVWRKRLPPLGTLERAGSALVALGFPMLTLGILSGIVRAASGGMAPGWLLDPKTASALLLWWVYGAYLVARSVIGWPGHRCAWVLVAGMTLCVAVLAVPTESHRFDNTAQRPNRTPGTVK